MTSRTCCPDDVSSLVALNEVHTQKNIQKQNKVGQSLYIQTIASLNNTIEKTNEGVKYDSYQRYLLKKKEKYFPNKKALFWNTPNYGNKTKSFSLTNKTNSNCDFCDNV